MGREWCGCECGKRYVDCHQSPDLLVAEGVARQEFRRLFITDYEDRQIPAGVIGAARSRWKKLPDMATTFAYRPSYDEPEIPLL